MGVGIPYTGHIFTPLGQELNETGNVDGADLLPTLNFLLKDGTLVFERRVQVCRGA